MFIFRRLGAALSLVRKKTVRYLPPLRRAAAPAEAPLPDLLKVGINLKAASASGGYEYEMLSFFY
jgi:hypothetical protein